MKIEQKYFTAGNGWEQTTQDSEGKINAQLVLVFGAGSLLKNDSTLKEILGFYPDAIAIGCSTAGEICGTTVSDERLVLTAIEFEKTRLHFAETSISGPAESFDSAMHLVDQLPAQGLKHVFVLSDGLQVNGTLLVQGLREHLPEHVHVTGGLAGDGAQFEKTFVLSNSGVSSNKISAIGFYGESLKVGFGSFGGWDSFGIERMVTSSNGNVLHEIDGEPALKLYKSFLGEKAGELPASGLLFPLSMRTKADETAVVRTILSVNEAEQSITFAGDLPEGSYVKMMKANIDRLINGAEKAAQTSVLNKDNQNPSLAILISCVGRKLVLKQMIEEEVEAVKDVLGEQVVQTGFYSYGEISPFSAESKCELHNQTMTITTFRED
ncbi:MAG: FIST N-terminal domain-containing protein [Bacteroidia bacterium]